MLVKLFDPSWLRSLPAGDQKLVELVCEHAGALERLIAEKGVVDATTLTRYRDAWERAADATPHGEPIELKPEYFANENLSRE